MREAGDERRGVGAHCGVVPLIPSAEVARNLPGGWVWDKRVLFLYYVEGDEKARAKARAWP